MPTKPIKKDACANVRTQLAQASKMKKIWMSVAIIGIVIGAIGLTTGFVLMSVTNPFDENTVFDEGYDSGYEDGYGNGTEDVEPEFQGNTLTLDMSNCSFIKTTYEADAVVNITTIEAGGFNETLFEDTNYAITDNVTNITVDGIYDHAYLDDELLTDLVENFTNAVAGNYSFTIDVVGELWDVDTIYTLSAPLTIGQIDVSIEEYVNATVPFNAIILNSIEAANQDLNLTDQYEFEYATAIVWFNYLTTFTFVINSTTFAINIATFMGEDIQPVLEQDSVVMIHELIFDTLSGSPVFDIMMSVDDTYIFAEGIGA